MSHFVKGVAHAGRSLSRMVRSAGLIVRNGGVRGLREMIGPFLFCRQRVDLFIIELSGGYSAPPLDPRVQIRRARPEDLAALRASPEGARSEFYRDRIDGAELWVALWEGQLAHIASVYDSSLPTRFVRLKPGEAELRFGYTCREFRNRGLYGATNAVMAADLARRGYQRVYGVVVDHGPAFRLGLEMALRRIGFRLVRRLTHLRVLGVQIRPHVAL